MTVKGKEFFEFLKLLSAFCNTADLPCLTVFKTAIEANIAQVDHLQQRLLLILLMCSIDELRLPFLICCFNFQFFHSQSQRQRLLEVHAVFISDMDVLDADLDVVNDLAGQVHHEALLLFEIVAIWVLVDLHQLLEHRNAVLDQALFQHLKLVLVLNEFSPGLRLEWRHHQLQPLDLQLHWLR